MVIFFTLIKVAALTKRRPKVKAHEKSEPKQQLGPSCCVTETNLAESPLVNPETNLAESIYTNKFWIASHSFSHFS